MADLDELIHQPVRLRIMASLVTMPADAQIEFTALRDLLELTDGNLGAHLRKLEEARYVRLDKSFVDRKPRTHVAATARGRAAFTGHIEALAEILAGSELPAAGREETS